MTACNVPIHRSDVICGSDTVDQPATENFGRLVQMWATDGIGGTNQSLCPIGRICRRGRNQISRAGKGHRVRRGTPACLLERSGAGTSICHLRIHDESPVSVDCQLHEELGIQRSYA